MAIIRRTRVPQEIEDVILALAKEQPKLGRNRVAAELNSRGLEATAATVRSVWQRHGLTNAAKRIAALALPVEDQPIVASPVTDETLVIPAPHEIAATRPVAALMSDALVFSVAVLTAISHDSSNDLDFAGSVSDTSDPILAVLGEDPGAAPVAHAPVETTDIFQFTGSHSDLLAA